MSRERIYHQRWFQGLSVLALLVLVAVVVHQLVPEPKIPAHSHPIVGDVIVNEKAGERIVFREVPPLEGDGKTVIDVHLEALGAVPVAHIHPKTDEVFRVLEGSVTLVVEGVPQVVKAGESIHVPAGQAHAVENQNNAPVRVQVEMSPTGGMNLALAQVHGFLNARGEEGGLVEFLQMLRFAERYEVYRGDLPVWFQQLGIALAAPLARALGFSSFYHAYAQEARDRNIDKEGSP